MKSRDLVEDVGWEKLIEAAKDGCDEALGRIVKRVRNYLLLVARDRIGPRVRSKFDESDVVQISLIDARHSIDRFRGSSEKEIRVWLTEIVLTNLIDQSRRYTQTKRRSIDREEPMHRFPSSLPDAVGDTPSVMLRRQETDSQLRRLVGQLPPQQRRVVEARHRLGYSFAKIGEQLGISESAARTSWSDAKRNLRDWLNAEGDR